MRKCAISNIIKKWEIENFQIRPKSYAEKIHIISSKNIYKLNMLFLSSLAVHDRMKLAEETCNAG